MGIITQFGARSSWQDWEIFPNDSSWNTRSKFYNHKGLVTIELTLAIRIGTNAAYGVGESIEGLRGPFET